ncbi:MAG: UDP-N-acetylmuramoyl-L-alanyl-D-glutamate--2,6-diaminopimelate ligase, partial [Myxococcales bacterium]|nr:UDP-N-acetylmuramoyl-L-alanyl-D-glutamate--2,6-diaminopimelate ligase [Myxococcales bacterium]
MGELALATLVSEGLVQSVQGDDSVRVRGVRHDSRAVEPGDLFAALPGPRHGMEFAPHAVERGAVAVLSDRPLPGPVGVPVVIAPDALGALSAIARRLYDDPTAGLTVVGITGTNGKTTVSYLIESMLSHAGHAPAVIGTVSFRVPGEVRPATHTTPMADDLMRLSRWAVERGASHMVLEVSSHALEMRRADGVHYAVAAFTNISQDHLDYHGDFDTYAQVKRRLFMELSPRASVINVDDAFGARLAAEVAGRGGSLLRCSRHADADAEIRVRSLSMDASGLVAELETPEGEARLTSPLVGEHNLENLLVTLGCGLALGMEQGVVLQGLAEARGAPGRLERVEHPEHPDVLVLVDYAHTPDALERALLAVRPITDRRLFVVFGCGGDRDRGKRPKMGLAAAAGADLAIVTDDNPRTEDPAAIRAEIVAGMGEADVPQLVPAALATEGRGYLVCGERRAARLGQSLQPAALLQAQRQAPAERDQG